MVKTNGGWVLDDMEVLYPFSEICSKCKHLLGFMECKAFGKIPSEIWEGRKRHDKPYPGDNGIQYELIGK